jgi:4'-phosphopantetheinyl transferase
MVEVFALNIAEPISSYELNKLITLVSEEKKKRIDSIHFVEDKKRLVYGDVLIKYLLIKRVGLHGNGISYKYNEYGKPFLEYGQSFNFNISHSGNWIVSALSLNEVGIDIEQIKIVDFRIAKRFFSKLEYMDLNNKSENNKLDYFYDLWTLKESYIKYLGKGLYYPLNSFSIRKNRRSIQLFDEQERKTLYFKQYKLGSYKLSVCSEEKHFFYSVINIKTIIKELVKS